MAIIKNSGVVFTYLKIVCMTKRISKITATTGSKTTPEFLIIAIPK